VDVANAQLPEEKKGNPGTPLCPAYKQVSAVTEAVCGDVRQVPVGEKGVPLRALARALW